MSLRGLALNAVTVDPNFGYPRLRDASWAGSRLLLRIQNLSSQNVTLTTEDDAIATLVLHEVQTETNRRPASPGLDELLKSIRLEAPESISLVSCEAILKEINTRAVLKITGSEIELNKTEKEFRQAADEMIHYREILRSREKSAR